MSSGISGWLERDSFTVNAPSSRAASRNSAITRADAHPRSGASISAYTSVSMPPVTSSAPGASKLRSFERRRSSSTSRYVAAMAAATTGRLT